jgi:hypothetical protein
MYAAGGSGISEIGGRRRALRYALAGIEAGVVGALVLLVWLMIAAYFTGRSVWYTPNLFATTFFGGGVYRNQFVRGSWTGVAAILAVYGILGLFWGWVWREKRTRGLLFFGALTGIGVYFLLFGLLLPHLNPLIAVYAPVRQLEIGHVLWGMMLARSPLYARRIDETISPAPPLPPEIQVAEPAVNSGELIQ